MATHDLTILAIDDDRFNLTTLRAVLADQLPDARLLTAPDGPQGIELARDEDPDVILLDILMPGMDGYEVCRRLKEDERLQAIPVLFLTALKTDRDNRIRALEAGAEGFLSKPFDELELTAQIRAMAKIKAANRLHRLEHEELTALVIARTRALEQDLEERRQIETTLECERDRAQLYLDTVETIIVALDTGGRITLVNRKGCKLLGYGEDELLGQSWFATCLPQPDGMETVPSYFLRLMAGEPAAMEHFENPVVTRSGELRQIAWHNTLLRDEWGRITGTLSSGEDITERRQAEVRLHKLNRTHALLSTVNQAIVRVHEPQELFATVCRIAIEVGGFRMAWMGLLDPQTRQVKPLAHAGETGDYLEKLNITLDDNERGSGPTASALKEGRTVVVNDIATDPRMAPWRADALRWGYRASAAFPLMVAGKVGGTLNLYAAETDFFTGDELELLRGLSADIAFAMEFAGQEEQRTQLERELQEIVAQLEKRNAELERFTYTVSHDLKTPLVTILGFIGQLEQDLENDERDYIKADFAFIENAAKKMHELLASLLELSRAGRAIGEPQPVDLPALVQQVTGQLASQFPPAGLRVAMPAGLPVVMGDPVRLSEVFQNLLENAAKFTAGVPEPLIEVGGTAGDGEVVCFVRDNGIGIPAAYQKKVFGLFEKLDPSTEGTGIGLAIVRRIVEEHGGMIWVESAGDGCGSTFFFTLPAGTPDQNNGS